MKVMYQGKEINIEQATEEDKSLDYDTPIEVVDNKVDLEDTIEITEDMQEEISGDQNG